MSEAAGEVKLILAADGASWSQALDKAKSQLKQLEGQVHNTSAHTRHEMHEATGSIALLGEEIGVHLPRHVRSFVASMPGVREAMAAAFSTVAVGVIAMTVFEAGKKVYEFIEKTREAAERNAEAWEKSRESVRMANLELSASTIHLQNELAKLEKKPENKVAEAIADTTLAVEKLQEKLQGAIGDAEKLLKEQAPGLASMFLLGESGTGDEQKLVKEHKKRMAAAKTFADQLAESQRYAGELAKQRGDLEGQQKTPSMPIVKIAGVTLVDSSMDVGGEINTVKQLQESQHEEQERIQGTIENDKAAAEVKAAQARKAADEEQKRANAETMQRWRRDLDAWRAVYDASAQDVATYWKGITESIKRNAPLAAAAQDEANKAQAEANKKYTEDLTKGWIKGSEDWMRGRAEDERISNELYQTVSQATRAIDERTREAQRAAREGFENTAAEIDAAERIGEATIAMQEQRGQLSRLGAALALQQLHQMSNDQWRQALGAAQNAGAGISLSDIERHGATVGRRAELDQAAVESATALGALRDAAGQLITRLSDMPSHIQQVLEGTVSTVNDAFLRTMTDPNHQGGWREAGRSIAGGVARSGLEMAEGQIFKSIPGLGAFGKLGTAANLMHVSVDAAPGMAAGGAGGGLLGAAAGAAAGGLGKVAGGIFSTLLNVVPFLAGGGPLSSGMPAIVGEAGPELFVPSSSGRVVSNSDMAGIGGMRFANTIHVDARGATDPAAIDAAVNRSMRPLIDAIPSMTVSALRSYNSRRPTGARI